jgi:hypothetical protein
MKTRIGPILAEVLSNELIAASGAFVIAVPAKSALEPWDDFYIPGTKAGFRCSLCNQDCILAPSGQKLVGMGKNRVVCAECMPLLLQEAQS